MHPYGSPPSLPSKTWDKRHDDVLKKPWWVFQKLPSECPHLIQLYLDRSKKRYLHYLYARSTESAYGCRTWRTSNAMKYTSKFHTSILLFLSWTHCVVISIQTEASQAVTGCRLPWATNPLVKRLLMLLSILSGDLDLTCTYLDVVVFVGSLDVVILDVDESLFFLEKQPGSPNSVRSPTKRRSIMDPRRVLENQMTLNSQLVGLLLVLWL